MSPIALLVVLAACGGGGGGGKHVSARIYLLRDGAVAPVAREVKSTGQSDLLDALKAGPTRPERDAGLSSGAEGSRAWLAQVVYTFTQGQPTSAVTYEGQRYTRSDFEDETPVILVESPLPFAHVTSPLRVTGTADTFEATFDYDLVGADGKVLAHHFVTATSGSGLRGTFAFTARFAVDHAQPGKLVVYELSAANGKRVHESAIPLTLEP